MNSLFNKPLCGQSKNKYCFLSTYLLILLLCFDLQAQSSSELSSYKIAETIARTNNATEEELQKSKMILTSLVGKYGASKQFCIKMGKPQRIKGPGGRMKWTEPECEQVSSIEPSAQLVVINRKIESIENAKALALVAIEKEQEKQAAAEALAKANRIPTDSIVMMLSIEEGYTDNVLDALEPLKVKLGFQSDEEKVLLNAVITLIAEPSHYIESTYKELKTLSTKGQFSLDGQVARAAKAGNLSMRVTISADNLDGILTNELITRVRN